MWRSSEPRQSKLKLRTRSTWRSLTTRPRRKNSITSLNSAVDMRPTAMWQEIGRLQVDEGLTILLTTHYMEEADRLASQLAIVDRGRVVAQGSPAELKASLNGDAVHVELEAASPNGDVEAALRDVPGLFEVLVEGRALHARAHDGARAVPAVLAALDAHAVPVATVTVARPSLDDAFLRYAGRSFASAERVPAGLADQHIEGDAR